MLKEEQINAAGVSELETQAREAYEQRRMKDCVALTKALLKADPENTRGRTLESNIQRDLQRDLADASALLDESLSQSDGPKYKKAAEIILLKVMYVDPGNEQAAALLAKAKGSPQNTPPSFPSTPQEPHPIRQEEVPFTTAPPAAEKKKDQKSGRLKVPIIIVAAIILVGAILLLKQSRSTVQGAIPESYGASQPEKAYSSTSYKTEGAATKGNATSPPNPSTGSIDPLSAAKTAELSSAANVNKDTSFDSEQPVAFVEAGTLSVSSPTSAEIYLGEKHLGTAPMSLQLLAGRHTLEYRHNELRTLATHNIKANQTTTAVINFDVTVQINARPWAQVFLEGKTRRALGQTPLSNVNVPLGSVLTFENPNFVTKTYRVTDAANAIQVTFP